VRPTVQDCPQERSSIAEKICALSEISFGGAGRFSAQEPFHVAIKIPLSELAWQPEIQALLKQTSVGDRCFPQLSKESRASLSTAAAMELHEALRLSGILTIWFDGCQELVVHRPLATSLCQEIENNVMVAELFHGQSSVALQSLLGFPEIQAALQHRGVPSGVVALDMLRLVISVSSRMYKIKGIGLDTQLRMNAKPVHLLRYGQAAADTSGFVFGPNAAACASQADSVLSALVPVPLANEGQFFGEFGDFGIETEFAAVSAYPTEVPPLMPNVSPCFEGGTVDICPPPLRWADCKDPDQAPESMSNKSTPKSRWADLSDEELETIDLPKAALESWKPEEAVKLPTEARGNSFMFMDSVVAIENRGEWRREDRKTNMRQGWRSAQVGPQQEKCLRFESQQVKIRAESTFESRSSVGSRGRDVTELSKLLSFYFQPFNLQHIRMFSSLVQEQLSRESSRWPPSDWRPSFSMEDLLALPRLSKHLGKYHSTKAKLQVLRKALSESGSQETDASRAFVSSPLHLEEGDEDGAKLVLTYEPKLRHIVGPGGRFPVNSKLKTLLDFEIGSHTSVNPPPPNMLLALSFSVASELSSCETRRGPAICKAIESGSLDSTFVTWEARLQQLKRQLLYYRADIMCLQALQCASSSGRCSEDSGSWFTEDEAIAKGNHLSHLYKELEKANYGVAYAPTVQLSENLSVGNAVFWNRSRWKMERHFEVQGGSAVCVQLASRVGGARILACSAKPEQTFLLEKGQGVTNEQLVEPLQSISRCLQKEAGLAEAVPILCGDFGCEPEVLQPALTASSPLTWQSACSDVLGKEPWTSASWHSCGKTVDYVLHDQRLKALAVLDGRPGSADTVELLRAGFPSDHLLMLVALEVIGVDSKSIEEPPSNATARPNPTTPGCAALPWAGGCGTSVRVPAKQKTKRRNGAGGGAQRQRPE